MTESGFIYFCGTHLGLCDLIMTNELMMVLRLRHQLETRWRTSWVALLEGGSHRHTTEQEEHHTFLSHDVSEALGRRKKEEEIGGDRELNCNTCWYCDDTCFFTLEKHAIGNTQVISRSLLHHRAATRKQGIVFTLGPHGQQLTFTK